jgi:hypothetical protein
MFNAFSSHCLQAEKEEQAGKESAAAIADKPADEFAAHAPTESWNDTVVPSADLAPQSWAEESASKYCVVFTV